MNLRGRGDASRFDWIGPPRTKHSPIRARGLAKWTTVRVAGVELACVRWLVRNWRFFLKSLSKIYSLFFEKFI